ncbi:MAG: energy transducer TonB [Phenylobacterium sp.]|nr:MAG: energy transducer TonB [Phenylobacterium sp.]
MGSLALHGAIITALVISWGITHDLKVGAVVPVTIVSNAPDLDVRPAEQAPQDQVAQTEAPVPEAPPQAQPPAPQPAPVPPKPLPTPTPPKTVKPPEKPLPQKAQAPAKPEKSLDLDKLAASLATPTAKPSSAAKGVARPETAAVARTAPGTGLSAAAMSGLASELQRRWNPNCDVEGGRDVQVKVVFQLDAGGQVVGQVGSQVLHGPTGAVTQAAADRAVRAVYAAAPFRDLPREFYGERISVSFNAHEACS